MTLCINHRVVVSLSKVQMAVVLTMFYMCVVRKSEVISRIAIYTGSYHIRVVVTAHSGLAEAVCLFGNCVVRLLIYHNPLTVGVPCVPLPDQSIGQYWQERVTCNLTP